MQVQSLGREDLLEDLMEEGVATHYSTLAWRIPMDRGAWWTTGHGVAQSDLTDSSFQTDLRVGDSRFSAAGHWHCCSRQ